MSSTNYGRKKILTNYTLNGDISHDESIIPKIIEDALPLHESNCKCFTTNEQWYFNDTEKILQKTKAVRTDVNNKITFATAMSVVSNNNGYCFGTPFKYVCNESDKNLQEEMQAFNKCLKLANNNKATLECAENGGIFGISYKLALKPSPEERKKGMYFKIVSDIDNFHTFKVYSNDIEKQEVLGVIYYDKAIMKDGEKTNDSERVFNCWTKWHQWVFVKNIKNGDYAVQNYALRVGGRDMVLNAFPLNLTSKGAVKESLIPLQEYERTGDRVGDFELSISLMNAINVLASCRVDSVQQSTDYIIKLRDIDVGEFDANGNNPVLENIRQFIENHILAVQSRPGADAQPDIDVLDIPLNQSEVQQLQDFLYNMLLEELQQPTRSGGTGQDTGIAVENRNGFRQFENKAVKITEFTIDAEKQFLAKLLEIGKSLPKCPFKHLEVSDIDINTMRNRSENLTNSTNNFREMVNAGVNRYTAYAVSGLVADINDTVKLDEEYQTKQKKQELELELDRQKKINEIKPQENNLGGNKKADGQKTD